MPRNRIIKTVVAPENLTLRDKRWRAEYIDLSCLVGRRIVGGPGLRRLRQFKYTVPVLTDLSQGLR